MKHKFFLLFALLIFISLAASECKTVALTNTNYTGASNGFKKGNSGKTQVSILSKTVINF
ncbi:MAG: hypothetical protein ACRDE8_17280 [Ginsengibacter sp.]